ncbi:type IVB secretion system protein IcmM/DotJ [Legionella dresdenensis]|uniref:Type IVB secretion system protein IcmM/DotJ n=1 Tax=Legionella dresdenensis TaxID=450200 RepID=A0ABV8CDX2_9GAMM
MSRGAWERIKLSKSFYVKTYRSAINLLMISVITNCVLLLLIIYFHSTMPERTYYASNGITAPVKLRAMLQANESAQALLPPDIPKDDDVKTVPQ